MDQICTYIYEGIEYDNLYTDGIYNCNFQGVKHVQFININTNALLSFYEILMFAELDLGN